MLHYELKDGLGRGEGGKVPNTPKHNIQGTTEVSCDSGFSMFGFQARTTCAPGLSGLEPRLKQRKRSLGATLVFASRHLVWHRHSLRFDYVVWLV